MESKKTENRRKEVLEASLNGIKSFLCRFKGNSVLEYVYEGDLQAAIYNSIKSSLENRKLNYGKQEWFISKRLGKTKTPCLVHCEQRYKRSAKGRGKAIDIAVWDPAEKNARQHYANKDLLLLIEIKYRSLAKWAIEEVEKDYNKLKKLVELREGGYPRGLALTFCADYCKNFTKGRSIDPCEVLKGRAIQAIVACRDAILEVPI